MCSSLSRHLSVIVIVEMKGRAPTWRSNNVSGYIQIGRQWILYDLYAALQIIGLGDSLALASSLLLCKVCCMEWTTFDDACKLPILGCEMD